MASPASRTRCIGALGTPGKYFQDFLNGSWLGHPLHPVLTDVVVGGATIAVVLDLLRYFLGVTGLEDALTLVDRPGLGGRGWRHRHGPDRLQGHGHRRRAQRHRLPRPDQHRRRSSSSPSPSSCAWAALTTAASGSSWSPIWSSRSAPTSAATWSSSTATWSIAAPSRAARRQRSSRPSCRRPSCRRRRPPRPASAPRRWCWCGAATWSAP